MAQGTPPTGEVFNFGLLHLEWTTALFVLVVFVITTYLLNILLFKPILRTLDARQSKLDRNSEKVADLQTAVEATEKEYGDKLSDISENIRLARHEALQSAKAEANRILEQAKEATSEKLEVAGKEIAKDREQAVNQVATLAKSLARLIETKALA